MPPSETITSEMASTIVIKPAGASSRAPEPVVRSEPFPEPLPDQSEYAPQTRVSQLALPSPAVATASPAAPPAAERAATASRSLLQAYAQGRDRSERAAPRRSFPDDWTGGAPAPGGRFDRTEPARAREARALRFVECRIDRDAFLDWMEYNRLEDPMTAWHHYFTETFGRPSPQGPAPRPFCVLDGDQERDPALLGYSYSDLPALRDAFAAQARPRHSGVIDIDGMQVRDLPARWQPGLCLGFNVLVMPVISVEAPERNDERDEDWFDERDDYRHGYERPPRRYGDGRRETRRETRFAVHVYRKQNPDITVKQASVRWLTRRFELAGAAEILNATTLLYEVRTRILRGRNGSDPRCYEAPIAWVRGDLRILDGDAFGPWLARGIGRNKAYGLGMLRLGPPHTTNRRPMSRTDEFRATTIGAL